MLHWCSYILDVCENYTEGQKAFPREWTNDEVIPEVCKLMKFCQNVLQYCSKFWALILCGVTFKVQYISIKDI